LQPFAGQPLARHALQRLAPQVGPLLVNANRHLETYRAWGVEVVVDTEADYPAPWQAFGRPAHCRTPGCWPCLAIRPAFPPTWPRAAAAAEAAQAPLALAHAPDTEPAAPHADAASAATAIHAPPLRAQPAFCLIHTSLLASLQQFVSRRSQDRPLDRAAPAGRGLLRPAGRRPAGLCQCQLLQELHALEGLHAAVPKMENR
jgi:molybdopterin-guanine dinucleotide biosynthesis protein A